MCRTYYVVFLVCGHHKIRAEHCQKREIKNSIKEKKNWFHRLFNLSAHRCRETDILQKRLELCADCWADPVQRDKSEIEVREILTNHTREQSKSNGRTASGSQNYGGKDISDKNQSRALKGTSAPIQGLRRGHPHARKRSSQPQAKGSQHAEYGLRPIQKGRQTWAGGTSGSHSRHQSEPANKYRPETSSARVSGNTETRIREIGYLPSVSPLAHIMHYANWYDGAGDVRPSDSERVPRNESGPSIRGRLQVQAVPIEEPRRRVDKGKEKEVPTASVNNPQVEHQLARMSSDIGHRIDDSVTFWEEGTKHLGQSSPTAPKRVRRVTRTMPPYLPDDDDDPNNPGGWI